MAQQAQMPLGAFYEDEHGNAPSLELINRRQRAIDEQWPAELRERFPIEPWADILARNPDRWIGYLPVEYDPDFKPVRVRFLAASKTWGPMARRINQLREQYVKFVPSTHFHRLHRANYFGELSWHEPAPSQGSGSRYTPRMPATQVQHIGPFGPDDHGDDPSLDLINRRVADFDRALPQAMRERFPIERWDEVKRRYPDRWIGYLPVEYDATGKPRRVRCLASYRRFWRLARKLDELRDAYIKFVPSTHFNDTRPPSKDFGEPTQRRA
jgi:hypothetical protein